MSYLTLTLGILLSAALLFDLGTRRIPNALIAVMLASGFVVQYAISGWNGALTGGGGLALGLVAFVPLYAKGGVGAGDVKLIAASGVFLGPALTVAALLYTLMIGGFIAAAKIAQQRLTHGGALTDQAIPYAPAIAGGVAASLAHPLF